MSCSDIPIQVIAGSECIGDSLTKINANFAVLGTAACNNASNITSLCSVPLFPIPSETIQSSLDGRYFSSSVAVSSLRMEHMQFEHGCFSFRNRIINGDMSISQRLEQTPTTINSSTPTYVVDRWYGFGEGAPSVATFTLQQSSLGPGEYCLIAKTVAPEISLGVTKKYGFAQKIEGYNIRDLKWGTLNASSIVISFAAKTNAPDAVFGGSVTNNAKNRSFAFQYSLSSNVWEKVSIQVPGAVDGTWLTNEEAGLILNFSLGAGLASKAELSGWSDQSHTGIQGQRNPISTAGEYIAIKNVQLEVGVTPTPFEVRPFQTELNLCKRYFEKSYNFGVIPGTATTENCFFFESGIISANYNGYIITPFTVEKRTPPSTAAIYSTGGAKNTFREVSNNTDKGATPSSTRLNTKFVVFEPNNPQINITNNSDYIYHWTADSEI